MCAYERNAKIELIATALHETKKYGVFTIHIAQNSLSKDEHVVLVMGSVAQGEDVICRIQSECLTGMVLDGASCECRDQLDLALKKIHSEGRGLLIFLRQEGRGHGLTHKIRALANKNAGYDTFAAVEMFGDEADIRNFGDAVEILTLLSVASVHLLTNNPAKTAAFTLSKVKVGNVTSLNVPPTEQTVLHLRAKKQRGHNIEL
jgi:3,4-dihydroxy 2-butanone 4-phosphate synthase/GTP cyclohydrolase II